MVLNETAWPGSKTVVRPCPGVIERSRDVAPQKARASVDERNRLRLWMSPYRYRGMPVFVGLVTHDIGMRVPSKTFITF